MDDSPPPRIDPPARAVAAAVNHMLAAAPWGRDKLAPYGGRCARFVCAPFDVALTVTAEGTVTATGAGATASAEFMLTPGLALRAAAGDGEAWREIRISGDAGFSSTLAQVAQHLRWDVEEDLSRVLGDIAAHRLVEGARGAARWGRGLLERAAGGAAAHVQGAGGSESGPALVADAQALSAYAREVARLSDDVDRIERRIRALVGR